MGITSAPPYYSETSSNSEANGTPFTTENQAPDSIPVSIVARTTPSPGTEASFLQQLLGNIGRFNAFSPNQGGISGGAPAPAY